MQRTSSTGADLSGHEISQAIKPAEIARAEFLRERPRHALEAIGVSVSVFGLAILLVFGGQSPRQQVLENTVTMERLATNLAHAERIAPKTVDAIAQLLHRPDYDCQQAACEARLEKRNLAARGRLQTVLAKTTSTSTASSFK